MLQVEETRIQVQYADPDDPGPHWHSLTGDDAIDWRPPTSALWFRKIQPFLSHIRLKSVKIEPVSFFLAVLNFISKSGLVSCSGMSS